MELRECLARLWKSGSADKWLTLNQMAFHCLESGNPEHAQLMGMMKSRNAFYFEEEKSQLAYPRIRVLWEEVRQDFPGPPWGKALEASISPLSWEEGLEIALEQERKRSYAHWQKHPVYASGLQELRLPGVTGFIYEAELEDGDDGAGGVLLEGTSVLVMPACAAATSIMGGGPMRATLLLFDPLEWKVVLEFEKPPYFHFNHRIGICPDVSRLIEAFKPFVGAYKTHELCRLLMTGKGDVPAGPLIEVRTDGLDEAQLEFIRTAVNNPVTYLWGPPGTGKTHTLAALICDLLLSGERVLAVAISNAAVDELGLDVYDRLTRIADGRRWLQYGKIMRYGHAGQKLLSIPEMFPHQAGVQKLREQLAEWEKKVRETNVADQRVLLNKQITDAKADLNKIVGKCLHGAAVVLTTISQSAISKPLREAGPFDTVVCDEASMANLAHILAPASLGRSRLVIAGDNRQLGPVVIASSPVALRFLGTSLFDARERGSIHAGHPVVQLREQRRMRPGICELVNPLFYDGKLRTHASIAREQKRQFPEWMSNRTMTTLVEHRGEVDRTKTDSRRNLSSAQLVVDLTMEVLEQRETPLVLPTIGLIAPYRAQVGLLRQKLKEAEGRRKREFTNVRVGTIHSFQGGECDIIIWDLVDCHPDKPGMPYWGDPGDRLANVAVSRAKKLLIVVGDDQTFINHQAVKGLRQILRQIRLSGCVLAPDTLVKVCPTLGCYVADPPAAIAMSKGKRK